MRELGWQGLCPGSALWRTFLEMGYAVGMVGRALRARRARFSRGKFCPFRSLVKYNGGGETKNPPVPSLHHYIEWFAFNQDADLT